MRVVVRTVQGESFVVEVDPNSYISCEECSPESAHKNDFVEHVRNTFKRDLNFTALLVQEYYRFIELKCCTKDWKCRKIFPSPLIDKIWEESLKDTYQYNKVCKSVHKTCYVSGSHHFIHRIPNKSRSMNATTIAYEARFTEPPSDAFWADDAEAESDVEKNPTCDCLCSIIHSKRCIPVDLIRLVHGGRLMNRSKTLGQWGVQNDDTVHLMVRLKRQSYT